MRLGIYSKSNLRDHPIKTSLTDGLRALGQEVVELDELGDTSGYQYLLVFGGDGTMLYAATRSACPVLGINLGNVGFLTQVEADIDAQGIIDTLKDCDIESKPILEVCINSKRYLALNDFVVKTTSPRPISLSVNVNGSFVDKYHSDGLIVSTPSGSTAYSLSAGGPVVSPDVKAIIINPICAHSLHSRPLIVSDGCTLDITIDGENTWLIVDGREQVALGDFTDIRISVSNQKAQFISDKKNFYNKLLDKMNKWGVTK